LSSLLPRSVIDQLLNKGVDNTNVLLVEIIKAFLNSKGILNLEVIVKESTGGKQHLIVEYLNELPAIMAIQASFDIISYIKGPLEKPPVSLTTNLNKILKNLNAFAPGELVQKMLFAAKKQKVPYFVLDYAASLVSYGQGHRSVLFTHASSEFDSHIGFSLQRDKTLTNLFLNTLGYPATEQKLASSIETSRGIIQQMGFPVVIKPMTSGQGKGVTSNIQNMQQVDGAFKEASRFSANNVIIEKHVVGDDHRITVSQGKVNGIGRRQAASIIGDGENNIRVLIKIENNSRKAAKGKRITIKGIDIDDALIQVLKDKQLSLDSIPEKGEQIYLRANSNLSTGGTVTIVEEDDVHPDNLEMAIDIARGFRLDSVGVDFITPDISLSWREVGVIIEINTFPMLSTRLANKLIENQFSNKNNGRIPTTLIVTDDQAFSRKIVANMESRNLVTGFTDGNTTLLNGNERTLHRDNLYQRCLSLLVNPACEELVVAMTPQDITKNGLPIDYFDHCMVDLKSEDVNAAIDNVTQKKNLEQWLLDHVGQLKTL